MTDDNDFDQPIDGETLSAIATALKPGTLTDARKQAMRTRLFTRIQESTVSKPAHSITRRASDLKWIALGPKIEVKVLRYDREQMNQTVLIRLHPGAVFPGHAHTQEEECLVLQGEVKVGDYPLYEGDMHIAKPGCVHPDIITENGALLMIRSEIAELPFGD